MLSGIFNSIASEELSLLAKNITIEKGKAARNGQISDSTYFYTKINLAKNCMNTIYKKILQKLKTDKLNGFIKKDLEIFIDFMGELTADVFKIITIDVARTSSAQENILLDKRFKEPLEALESEIIMQWNNEANIQGHLKKQERSKQFKIYLITFLISLTGTIIAGVFLNQFNHQAKTVPVQKIIQKEVRIKTVPMIEKIQVTPSEKKKAADIYDAFKNMDKQDLIDFLKAIYAKIS